MHAIIIMAQRDIDELSQAVAVLERFTHLAQHEPADRRAATKALSRLHRILHPLATQPHEESQNVPN